VRSDAPPRRQVRDSRANNRFMVRPPFQQSYRVSVRLPITSRPFRALGEVAMRTARRMTKPMKKSWDWQVKPRKVHAVSDTAITIPPRTRPRCSPPPEKAVPPMTGDRDGLPRPHHPQVGVGAFRRAM